MSHSDTDVSREIFTTIFVSPILMCLLPLFSSLVCKNISKNTQAQEGGVETEPDTEGVQPKGGGLGFYLDCLILLGIMFI